MTDKATGETRKDIDATTPTGLVGMWLTRLQMATKREKKWREMARDTVERFRGETSGNDTTTPRTNRTARGQTGTEFNILWSNTNILLPSLYLEAPKPNIRRRYRDEDRLGKDAAEVQERAALYTLDEGDFDEAMEAVTEDYVLPGRGIARVRYVPDIRKTQRLDDEGVAIEGEFDEELLGEHAVTEPVEWPNFRVGEGTTWKKINWIAFKHGFTRERAIEAFGETKGKALNLTHMPKDVEKRAGDLEESQKEFFKEAEVWEIWDREKKRVVWVSDGFKEGPLQDGPPPNRFAGFYPTPKPLYSVPTNGTTIPLPEYAMYEEQAIMIDKITTRIDKIIGALRVRGVYDASISELRDMLKAGDNTMTPVENWQQLAEKGGLAGVSDFFDLSKYVSALQALYQAREAEKAVVFEVTGISDLQRGQAKASEPLGTQQLKTQFSSQRLQKRKKDINRYARDLVRLICEVMAENFSIDTYKKMTGLQFPTNEEREQADRILGQALAAQQQQAQQAQGQQGQQPLPNQVQAPAPELVEQAKKAVNSSTWEEIIELLRNDDPRSFRIDVETNVTAAAEVNQEKADVVELLTAIGQFWQAATVAIQGGHMDRAQADALILALVRKFNLGRQVEDILDPDNNKRIVEQDPQIAQLTQALQQAQQQLQQLQGKLDEKMTGIQANAKTAADKTQATERINANKLEEDKRKHDMDFTIDQQNVDISEADLALEAAVEGENLKINRSSVNSGGTGGVAGS